MNNEKENKTPKRMHGPGGRGPGEKPKDFKKALSKLNKYLKPYKHLIIIAIVLSALSSILSIIGPNKIKDLTNEIQQGLIINKTNMELLVKDIQTDIQNNIILDDKSIETLSEGDKLKYYEVLSEMYISDNKEKLISKLPESVKLLIFKDTTIDNVIITNKDKVEFINTMSKVYLNEPTKIYGELDKLSKNINELIKPSMDITKIKKIAFFLVTVYLISAIFSYFENILMVVASNNFAKSLRTKISKKINKLPLKYFDKNSYGDILSRVTNDVDTINMSLQNSLSTLVGAVALFIGAIIMMFVTNYIMAITCILSSLFGFGFMGIILSKSQKYFNQRQVELGKLNGHIEEIYSSHNVVKAYNGEEEALKKFDVLNKNVYDCNRKSQFLSGLMPPMMGFIGNFSYVAVCIVGAILTLKGNITFGTIVAFMIYVRLFTSPLSQIAQSMTQLQTASAASERVFEFIEENEMTDESNLSGILDPKKVQGNIDFEHVKFGYDEDKIIIKDFNCNVTKGQKVAIVGPTGAGKTTIVNLLMKFYEINSGNIKIDGISTKNLTRENIHDLFIMVLQDTWLFDGTIRDNIKFNKTDVSDKEIWKALEVVGVDHFVKSLPKTLDYKMEDNESISAGQKQLLTIVRGMIKDAPFLILDEATSSVDTRTEELVQKAMDKLTEGRTSFIIAHRLSTIKNADIILVMKDGNIIETGSHDELMKKNGFYAELYNSQFQN